MSPGKVWHIVVSAECPTFVAFYALNNSENVHCHIIRALICELSP